MRATSDLKLFFGRCIYDGVHKTKQNVLTTTSDRLWSLVIHRLHILVSQELSKRIYLNYHKRSFGERWEILTYINKCKTTIKKGTDSLYISFFANTASENNNCFRVVLHSWQKRLLHPIEENRTNVDRTFVFPLGWNWHDMDPWLFPNEIRHYLRQTFNARTSGIVELRNHSIGGRSPKSIFTLWQLWINIFIFFQKFFWFSNNAPSNPYWY